MPDVPAVTDARGEESPVQMRFARRVVAIAVVAVLGLPQAAAAFGYRDTGFDPPDRTYGPDIRSTTRKVWASADGRGWLTIRLDTYGAMGLWWETMVRLDTRGGPLTDHWMRMGWWDQSGRVCAVRPRGTPSWTWGDFAQGDRSNPDETASWARCKVPLRAVDPNKRIRWKALGEDLYGEQAYDEYAPNGRGWYP